MEEQDIVVNTPAEVTAPTESTPVETEPAETQQSPADASVEPEKKVSETVPYSRFKEEVEKRKQLEEFARMTLQQNQPAPSQPDSFTNEAPFDEETTRGVQQLVQMELARKEQEQEARRAAKFVEKHAEDLKDPVVARLTKAIIAEANSVGQRIDQEEALAQAKAELDQRFKPQVQQAEAKAVEEGQELAKRKQQAGAVGTTTTPNSAVSDDQLTAAQWAEKHNLPRI